MSNLGTSVGKASQPVFSTELIDAQGKNDREYLTTQVKLLLEAKEKHPSASFADIAQIAKNACGCGTCCCCGSLVFGADVINPSPAKES